MLCLRRSGRRARSQNDLDLIGRGDWIRISALLRPRLFGLLCAYKMYNSRLLPLPRHDRRELPIPCLESGSLPFNRRVLIVVTTGDRVASMVEDAANRFLAELHRR